MNNTLDTLIDSAFAKDRAHLPVLPAEPDAALLSKLEATAAASSAAIDAPGTSTLGGIGVSKFFLGIGSLMAIGALLYTLSGSSVQHSGSGNPTIFFFQDSVKPKKPADTIHAKDVIKEKMTQAGALRMESPSDSLTLIYPQGAAKKYPSDSTGVPIRK